MTIKVSTYICVVLFGSTSWLSTNSVWLELPLLTENLPEGWSLPSYLTVVVQTASIGPLVYSIIRKFSKISIPVPGVILTLLLFCCLCTGLMALFWSQTIFLFGQERSVTLMILLFGMALVNGTSNVLFMPYMATFHASYLTAYFVGMGLSALFPSVVSILQGSGNDCVVGNGTSKQINGVLRFDVAEFNFIMLGWMLLSTAAFVYLTWLKNTESAEKKELKQSTETTEDKLYADKLQLGLLLFLMATINAQMNGIVPSVQSYASLPFSQKTYHLGLTLSNIVSPIVCFLPLFVQITRLSVLASLTVASAFLTALIITFAAMSPTPVLQFSAWGSAFIIIIVVCSVALNSYLRTVLATVLGDDTTDNEMRLFWGGVFIQIGSFLGSLAMFPLINICNLFVPAPPCP
uniref:Riboflavin transporter n=1 Tax=Elaeophora elaphi TaxID=1147741 RepID=A0A0R3S632_9BILA